MSKSNARRMMALYLGTVLSMSMLIPAFASTKNLVTGTWLMVSAKANPDGENKDLFSAHPMGILIFTKDLHFADVLVNPTVANFAAGDRMTGTAAENKAVVVGDLALYGTYTVDQEGRFATEHVIASIFPNWTGLNRDTGSITETVNGDTMVERLKDTSGPQIVIVWRRAL